MAFEHELMKDMIHKVEVVGIVPCKTSFTVSRGQKEGETQFCHYIKVVHPNYPEPFDVQICNYDQDITQFEVGDTIKIKAGTFNKSANLQTVKFESKLFTKAAIETKTIVDSMQAPDAQKKKDPIQGEHNSNPQIQGTIYSKSMSDACALYSGSPMIPLEKLFETADAIVVWYQKKLGL